MRLEPKIASKVHLKDRGQVCLDAILEWSCVEGTPTTVAVVDKDKHLLEKKILTPLMPLKLHQIMNTVPIRNSDENK